MKRRFWTLVYSIYYWWDSMWTQECVCMWLPWWHRPCSGCWSRRVVGCGCLLVAVVLVLLVCWVWLLLTHDPSSLALLDVRVLLVPI